MDHQKNKSNKQKRKLREAVSWQSLRTVPGCEAASRRFGSRASRCVGRERSWESCRQSEGSGEVLGQSKEKSSPVPASVEGGRNRGADLCSLSPRGHRSRPVLPHTLKAAWLPPRPCLLSHPGRRGPWSPVAHVAHRVCLLGRAACLRHSPCKLPV